MVASCSALDKPHGPIVCLAPQTWSLPDYVRTDLRTLRLAIACGDHNDRAMHHRKCAATLPIHILMEARES